MNSPYKHGADLLPKIQETPAPKPQRMNDEDFFAACASLKPNAALANDPRTKAFQRATTRRDASLYREDN